MRVLLIAFILTCLGCSKDDGNDGKYCWTCQVAASGGNPGYTDNPCNEDGTTPIYKDNLGNLIQSNCTRR